MKHLRALLLLSALPLFAQDPWDAPAFSAEPKAMLAAAAEVGTGEDGVVVLLDEAVHTFETDGRKRTVARMIYRIDEQSAVQGNDQVTALWQPWFDDKPVIEARVITKDGTVHMLDANAITEAPSRESSLDIFSDDRVLRAPLPAVAVGSIVEHIITTNGRSPIEGAGVGGLFVVGRWVPLHRARLVLDGPAGVEPRIVNRSGLEPKIEEADGRRRVTFTSEPREQFETIESYVPFDEADYPYIAFSTGSSWQQIASHYAKIVDGQIAGSDLKKLVKSAVGDAKKPREITARILAAIQKDIRYAGVEVGEGSIIPRTPATVLQNKYGDCKDKATLLVAMLREAGLTAHVALLRAGADLDTHADLPGLDRFNHAIVRVLDGRNEIWIDPTDEFARAGELPIADQGRMALIAAAGTSSLTRTPELPSTANRYAETRIFNLNEHGKAPVVEITETAGPNDAEQRRYYVTTAAETYRENMESYVKSYYVAKSLASMDVSDAHDLETPFKLTLAVEESGSGVVYNGEASVALHPSALFSALPESLRNWSEPQPDDDPDDAPKPRVHDFVFPQPIVKEWTYRIVPPAGYVPRELPQGQSLELGTTTFTSEYTAGDDGVVTAKLRFDSGRRRISAKEYEETRVAISKFIDEPQINIGFDMIGQARLAAGDVAGALAEYRRLAALHPKEAQHHIELASALLSGGLGEPAREEARLAVTIEPDNARAHLALGQVLIHDLLGRKFRKGADVPAAIASMRKAKELDPENLDVRLGLARLFKHNADGFEFGEGAMLAESIAEYRAITKDFGSEQGSEYDGELMMVLAHAGRFDELKELAATVEDKQRRNVGRLLAVAATEGKDVLVRELAKFDLETRRVYAAELGQHLMNLRYYPESAAMFEAATQGTAGSPETTFLISTLRKAKRLETGDLRDDDPTTIMARVMRTFIKADVNAFLDVLAPEARTMAEKELAEKEEDPLAFMKGSLAADDMRPAVMADFFASMLETNLDSDGFDGFRIRHRVPGEDDDMVLFVTKEAGGRYLLRAFEDDESLGHAALHFLEKNQPERARIWLNWGREALEAADADDPLSRQAFAMVWPKAKQSATADEIRLAAAAQIAQMTDDEVGLLLELREKADSDATKLAIDRALATAYNEKQRWADLLPVARRLYTAHPDSTYAFNELGTALAFTGNHDEAAALANKRLEQFPNDRDALRVLAQNAGAKRDYATAAKYAQRVLDETSPKRDDFNNAAWYGLMTGNLERAIAHALEATDDDKAEEPDPAALHTLASLYAESDKPLEAREALLNSMLQRNRDQPKDEDWYVLGRIAETSGVREAAVAAYKRVPKEKENDSDTGLAELVARRVAKLK